jgi:acyl carrier protein
MGLDSVELVMAIEEGFGVNISDAEAETCITPSLLIDVVFAKLRSTDERVCLTQRAFYLLRNAAIKNLGVARKAVVLDADIRSLARDRNQKIIWNNLKTEIQARSWPALARPSWLTVILGICSVFIFLSAIYHQHWIMATAGALLFAVISERTTRPFKRCIPSRHSTFRKLVPSAMTSNFISWTRTQVALLVRKIVIEQLGLKEGQYRENANFVKDLRMD